MLDARPRRQLRRRAIEKETKSTIASTREESGIEEGWARREPEEGRRSHRHSAGAKGQGMKKKNDRGISLIEIVLVVTVSTILAAACD